LIEEIYNIWPFLANEALLFVIYLPSLRIVWYLVQKFTVLFRWKLRMAQKSL